MEEIGGDRMKQEIEPMWMKQSEFRRMFRIENSTYHRWRKRGIIPESAISREPGRHPYVDAAQVFPEQVAAMREYFERSGK